MQTHLRPFSLLRCVGVRASVAAMEYLSTADPIFLELDLKYDRPDLGEGVRTQLLSLIEEVREYRSLGSSPSDITAQIDNLEWELESLEAEVQRGGEA